MLISKVKSTMNFQEAKETKVFILEPIGQYTPRYIETAKGKRQVGLDFNMKEIEVIETNYYDHVMESLPDCNSPGGVTAETFIRENEEGETFEVRQWKFGNSALIESFETEEEAEDYLFHLIERYDFEKDDQRNTEYFLSKEEAEDRKSELLEDLN